MSFDEFIAIIKSDFADASERERASAFIADADIETLWKALRTRLIKSEFATLINESLSKKVAAASTDEAMARIASRVLKPKGPK